MTEIPYGAWPSPISAADVARGARALGGARIVGDEVWWTEGRPQEAGRLAVVRRTAGGEIVDVLPAPWNARSRVHEYGGSSWTVVDGALVFVNFADQRIYRLDPGATEPMPLTPDTQTSVRYAEPTVAPDSDELWWIRESHTDAGVRRHIVAVPLDGSEKVREIVGGRGTSRSRGRDEHGRGTSRSRGRDEHGRGTSRSRGGDEQSSDFLAYPRPSPDGRQIAWIAWDHPRMPWDGTELRVAPLHDGVAGEATTLLGGVTESVLQPTWHGDGELYVVSDRSGWWNLYAIAATGGDPRILHQRSEEFGGPLWMLGMTWYAEVGGGRLAVLHGTDNQTLGLLDPADGTLRDLGLPYTAWSSLAANGSVLTTVSGSPTDALAVRTIDLQHDRVETVRASRDALPDAAYLPTPYPLVADGVGGRDVHAHVYPPTHPSATAPEGELPPYIVTVHGGPTSQSRALLDLSIAFFTSRGIGVIDVNYGGSTGYGRAYRDRLLGQWGVVDVEDVVSAVEALVARGDADGGRLGIRGGSAGGWTTLAALTRTDTFGAGASYFGVAELLRFAQDTHDFESRYLDSLVGPLPEAEQLYVDRAPLSHVDGVSCPVLLLQGDEDKIVPPSQAEMFRDALVRKGIPHAYLLFEGEQHGFRKAENQIVALEAELSFYGQVFGFDPPGVPRLELSSSAD